VAVRRWVLHARLGQAIDLTQSKHVKNADDNVRGMRILNGNARESGSSHWAWQSSLRFGLAEIKDGLIQDYCNTKHKQAQI